MLAPGSKEWKYFSVNVSLSNETVMTCHNAKTAKQIQAVSYEGRVLTSEEVLGLSQPSLSWRKAIPLLLFGWLGLLVILANPLLGVMTTIAAPVFLARITAQLRS
jgi:hypothetical protein